MRWFKPEKSPPKDPEDLGRRLAGLEAALRQLAQRPVEYNVTIEHVHIHQPVLEKLAFRLDRLEIDELSGALNLGNNFGTKVDRKEPEEGAARGPKDAPDRNKQARAASFPEGSMTRTADGYSFSFGKTVPRRNNPKE